MKIIQKENLTTNYDTYYWEGELRLLKSEQPLTLKQETK